MVTPSNSEKSNTIKDSFISNALGVFTEGSCMISTLFCGIAFAPSLDEFPPLPSPSPPKLLFGVLRSTSKIEEVLLKIANCSVLLGDPPKTLTFLPINSIVEASVVVSKSIHGI